MYWVAVHSILSAVCVCVWMFDVSATRRRCTVPARACTQMMCAREWLGGCVITAYFKHKHAHTGACVKAKLLFCACVFFCVHLCSAHQRRARLAVASVSGRRIAYDACNQTSICTTESRTFSILRFALRLHFCVRESLRMHSDPQHHHHHYHSSRIAPHPCVWKCVSATRTNTHTHKHASQLHSESNQSAFQRSAHVSAVHTHTYMHTLTHNSTTSSSRASFPQRTVCCTV